MASYTNSLPRYPQQQQQLREFQHRSKMLLNVPDREYLYGVMKEYQRHRYLDKFMLCVRTTLDTPAKMDLLKDIRSFVSVDDLEVFDRLAPYHKMAHPWQQPPPSSTMPAQGGTPHSGRARPTPQHTPATRHRGAGQGQSSVHAASNRHKMLNGK